VPQPSPREATNFQNQPPPLVRVPSAPWRSLIVEPDPRLKGQIHFYDKLNPVWWFRNLAEPIAPAWYRPNDPHRNLKYHLRNPGANFCRFVIGISDKKFVRSGRYPELMARPQGGLNFAVSRRKLVVLPSLITASKNLKSTLAGAITAASAWPSATSPSSTRRSKFVEKGRA